MRVLLIGLLVGTAAPAFGLEKAPRAAADFEEAWARSGTCLQTLSYYNTCSAWGWTWSGFQPGDNIAVSFERADVGWYPCHAPLGRLHGTAVYTFHGVPSGYGYTGTVQLYASDENGLPTGTPGPSQTWLPRTGQAYELWFEWVPPRFVVVYTLGPGEGNPLSLYSDGPAGPPGGPPDMGRCYPTTRQSHSRVWSSGQSPSEASYLMDSVGAAELLAQAAVHMPFEDGPTSVGAQSWGRVKSLYR